MKKLLLITAMLFSFIGMAFAEEVSYTYPQSGGKLSTEIKNGDELIATVTFSAISGTAPTVKSGYIQFLQNHKVTVTVAEGIIMTQVVFSASQGDFNTGTSVNTGELSNLTWTGEANTFTIEKKSGKQVRVTGLAITYTKDSGLPRAELSYSSASCTQYLNATEPEPYPTLTHPEGLTINYTSSDETVATINNEGAISIVGAGNTVIKATSVETETLASGSAEYTLNVIDASVSKKTYVQLTDISNLTDGTAAIIVCKAENVVMGKDVTDKGPAITTTIAEDGSIEWSEKFGVITFIKDGDNYNLKLGESYLTHSENKLALNSEAQSATITLNTQHNASINFTDDASKHIRYNNSANMFRYYSSEMVVQLFVEQGSEAVEAPAAPTVAASETGVTSEDGNEIVFAQGSTTTVCLTAPAAENVRVYYSINNGAPVRYTAPFEVSENATISYYSEINGVKSEIKTINAVALDLTVNCTIEPVIGELNVTVTLTSADHAGVEIFYKYTEMPANASLRRATAEEGYALYEAPFVTSAAGTLSAYAAYGTSRGTTTEQEVTENDITSGVESVAVDSDTAAEYYDLSGRRIENPVHGLYIRRTSGSAVKVYIR